MEMLQLLLDRCKCGVYLTVNEHRDVYETVEEQLEMYAGMECPPDISPEVTAGILATQNIVDLHFYPDTPIGFYHIVHYDLKKAVEIALALLRIEVNHDSN